MDHKEVNEWKKKLPLIDHIMKREEVLWLNPLIEPTTTGLRKRGVTAEEVQDASNRLQRFAPYIEHVFPETKGSNGIIESPLTRIPNMKNALANQFNVEIAGELLLKEDNALPISGSIKARGGIYEILKHAETLAIRTRIDNNRRQLR